MIEPEKRIAFFGSYDSFDYHHIGGAESITRRLGISLIVRGQKIDFIYFNCHKAGFETTHEGLRLCYFRDLRGALEYVVGRYDHVLNIYVPFGNRLTWARFRRREAKRTLFHIMFTAWHEKKTRRLRGFIDSRIAPYNGTSFCISPRIYRYVSRWAKNAKLLLPPVPESYFLSPEDKARLPHIRITYMGRIDPGKGTPVAIGLFRYLARKGLKAESRICGYHWGHKPDTVKLHRELLSQNEISYEPVEFQGYSQDIEDEVRRILRETDVLFLPYDKLSSTVDTPLLLLEGMAHLCVIITRPLGDMPEIYGTDEFMLDDLSNNHEIEKLIGKIQSCLQTERERLFDISRRLRFSSEDIADEFLSSIEEDAVGNGYMI